MSQNKTQELPDSSTFKNKNNFFKQPISSKKIRNTKNLSLKSIDYTDQHVKKMSTIMSPLSKPYLTKQKLYLNILIPTSNVISCENENFTPTNNHTYENKPVCIIEPNIWLFAEPETHIAEKFNVVINVAKEVKNPFLSQTSLEDSSFQKKASISNEKLILQKHPLPIESSILPPVVINDIEYLHVLWDHDANTLSIDLPPLIDYITKKSIQENKKVLIHCQCGISRSASLIIAYVMKSLGLNIDSAYSY
ncbi:hypothetical protein PCK2_000061, partial [Pneumocystis canis]